MTSRADKPKNITPVIATYGRWSDVAKLSTALAMEIGTKPIIINDAGPWPEPSLEKEIRLHSLLVTLPRNLGQAGAVHEGMKLVETSFAMIIDSDDHLDFKNDWEQFTVAMDPNALHLPENLEIRGAIRRRTETFVPTASDMRKNSVGTLSGMILSRELYFDLQGYDGEMISCKDWDFWLRAIQKKATIRTYPATLHYATDNPGISRDLWRVYSGRLELWEKHTGLFRPSTRICDVISLLSYSGANCSVVAKQHLLENASLGFYIFSIAHFFSRMLYLFARPILRRR